MARPWEHLLTDQDRIVFRNYEENAASRGFGSRPALIIVDVNYYFVGDKPEPIVDSIRRFPMSCGLEGWEGVRQLRSLLPAVREAGVPVIYTTGGLKKMSRGANHGTRVEVEFGNTIPSEIAPQEDDLVIYKDAPSPFFGTSLVSYLRSLDVDTTLICGTTTSGCVRAAVIDAFSHSFKVGIVEECTFDRAQFTHVVNLFDMHAKYGTLVSVQEVKEYVAGLGEQPGAEKVEAVAAIQ
jgi:nicotinamidase-related amidase